MAQEIALTAPERVRSLCLLATHPGIAHAVMNPEAVAILGKRGELTPQEAAEASVPFNYAPSTPRGRIEQDWAVRLPLAATNEGYLAQASGTSQWDGYDRLDRITAPTLVVHGELDALVPPANGQYPRRSHSRSRARDRPAGEPPPRHRPAGAGLRATGQLAGSPPLNPVRRTLRDARRSAC
jgi:pimeloyl-ACP methyl ester carboxylesterase